MRRRLFASFAVTLAVIGASAAPAAARTIVKVDGKHVTITVPIDCVGCKGKRGPDGRDLAKYWEKTAESAWNTAFNTFSYCNKYKLELDIEIKARGDDFDATKGRHRILVGAPGSGLGQTGWDGLFEATPGGAPGQRSPDGTRYFTNDGDGAMPVDVTPTVLIHELGHVIGLGDDRDAAGNSLPGRDPTIMVGGARLPDGTMVSPDTPLRIDKQLIDRIGEQLANLGEIDCGVVWNGTLRGVGDNVGICDNASAHRGTFTIRERPNGDATFAGRMRNTAGTGCGAAGRPETTTAAFRIAGTRTNEGFQFPADPNFPFPVHFTVSGNRASAHTAEFVADSVYRVTIDLKATCECDDAGVG